MFGLDYFKVKPFVGIVKDVEPNRVRVRIFGVHPFDDENQSSGPAQVAVSDGDLPWASIIYPINNTGADHSIEIEDWVVGFFYDGDSAQMPVVTGKIEKADGSEGVGFTGPGPSSGGGQFSTDSGGSSGGGSSGGGSSGGGSSGGGSSGGGSSGGGAGSGTSNSREGAPVRANRKGYYDNIPGDSNTQRAFNLYSTWLIEEQGMPKERAFNVAAGIISGLSGESGTNLNPGSYNPNDRGKPSEGIAQWRADRQQALWQMCGKNNGNLVCQLNFSLSELENRGMGHRTENTERSAKSRLLKASTKAEAVDAWVRSYERPQYPTSEVKKRTGAYSQATINKWKQNYQPATITSKAPPSS